MNIIKNLAIAAILIVCSGGLSTGAEVKRPTIRVAPTLSQLPTWQPALGEGLAQMMITELVRLTNLQVLESVALDDLREERTLGESGEIERSERIKKGHWKGAEYTFKTTITRFGGEQSSFGGSGPVHIPIPIPFGGGGGFRVQNSKSEVQIDWRVIDNTTGAIAKSGRGVGVQSGKAFSFAGFGGGGWSNNREFMDSALGKATMKAIASIVTELEEWTPPARSGSDEIAGKKRAEELAAIQAQKNSQRRVKTEVLLVDGDEIWIAIGSTRGFAAGDRLKIYRGPHRLRSRRSCRTHQSASREELWQTHATIQGRGGVGCCLERSGRQ
jgi:curli biogenesis system outer membrane secretion channel CsgG